jgi:hypothetical protein
LFSELPGSELFGRSFCPPPSARKRIYRENATDAAAMTTRALAGAPTPFRIDIPAFKP